MKVDISGEYKVYLDSDHEKEFVAKLPGSLDENKIGLVDDILITEQGKGQKKAEGPIATRLTRKFSYYGKAYYKRGLSDALSGFEKELSKRLFIKVERSRNLFLKVDDREVKTLRGSLSTPYLFEVTGLLKKDSTIEFICDNDYENMPRAGIIYSSTATDETQTNWNGLLGQMSLFSKECAFVERLSIYPKAGSAEIEAVVNSDRAFNGKITLNSEAFADEVHIELDLAEKGSFTVKTTVALKKDVRRWDEYEGNLYSCKWNLFDNNGTELDESTETFGIRDFSYDNEGRLTINGRRFFLRGEANCAEFPETGHAPMDVESWLKVMEKYKSYGINCVRFHSHCPVEAAFVAADKLGIMVQPELSHWNPNDAFVEKYSREYYEKELKEIIKEYANHPSFVMLTLGNELGSDIAGTRVMIELVKMAKDIDDTRLFAWGSNVFYGEKGYNKDSDFYTSMGYYKDMLRATSPGMIGFLNNEYPSASHDFSKVTAQIRNEYKKPIFGFEVGQYEVLPDFNELEDFKGVTDPVNLKLVKEHADKVGILRDWDKYVEATGELSRLCYREEVESVLRTPDMSGLSLLGIQDFPGQGTALVGMMNSHLEPKKYDFAKAEKFRAFYREALPLVLLPKYTYTDDESVTALVKIANYGKKALEGTFKVKLVDAADDKVLEEYKISENACCKVGELTEIGKIDFSLSGSLSDKKARELLIIAYLENTDIENTYPIWVYQKEFLKDIQSPENVYETRAFDDKAIEVLENGGIVYLSPDSTADAIPSSIKCQFSPDFWCADMFKEQEGSMGQLINKEHPIFKDFPTNNYSQWQWWPMASQRAFIMPEYITSIITEMDSYMYLRPMSMLFEAKCLKGKVLASSMGLHNLLEHPEARALLMNIYRYISSDEFEPEQEIDISFIQKIMLKN